MSIAFRQKKIPKNRTLSSKTNLFKLNLLPKILDSNLV